MPFSGLKRTKILSNLSIEIHNDGVNSSQEILTVATAPNFVQPLLVACSIQATNIMK